jgi:putative transcriptional regulator
MPIRNHLRARREQRGWTQDEMAAHIGCARGTLNQIENHRRDPNPEIMLAAARALDARVEDLFELMSEKQFARFLKSSVRIGKHAVRLSAVFLLCVWLCGSALAAIPGDRFQPDWRWNAHLAGYAVLHPLHAREDIAALGAPSLLSFNLLTRPLTKQYCQQWISRFRGLANDSDDPMHEQLLHERANCFDAVGDGDAALGDRLALINADITDPSAFNTVMLSRGHAIMLFIGAMEGAAYKDTAESRKLLASAESLWPPTRTIITARNAYCHKISALHGDQVCKDVALLAVLANPTANEK